MSFRINIYLYLGIFYFLQKQIMYLRFTNKQIANRLVILLNYTLFQLWNTSLVHIRAFYNTFNILRIF